MKLSILICSVPSRVRVFGILDQLIEQTKGKDVEVIYLGDNWKQSIGEKRNHLVNMAKGDYVTFVDDDDRLSKDYISSILDAIKTKPDVVCYRVAITQDKGKTYKDVFYSKEFHRDKNLPNHYERLPNHLMVFKRSLMIPFKPVNMGEDYHFGRAMKRQLRTEIIINKTLYYYEADQDTSESFKRHHNIER